MSIQLHATYCLTCIKWDEEIILTSTGWIWSESREMIRLSLLRITTGEELAWLRRKVKLKCKRRFIYGTISWPGAATSSRSRQDSQRAAASQPSAHTDPEPAHQKNSACGGRVPWKRKMTLNRHHSLKRLWKHWFRHSQKSIWTSV